jgi:hypothetical protein
MLPASAGKMGSSPRDTGGGSGMKLARSSHAFLASVSAGFAGGPHPWEGVWCVEGSPEGETETGELLQVELALDGGFDVELLDEVRVLSDQLASAAR